MPCPYDRRITFRQTLVIPSWSAACYGAMAPIMPWLV